MGYYVKVTKKVAEQILPKGVKATKTKDDNCLLWQSELNGIDGVNLSERVKNVGGALLSAIDAMEETKGNGDAYCYTPIEYGGDGDTRKLNINHAEEGDSEDE